MTTDCATDVTLTDSPEAHAKTEEPCALAQGTPKPLRGLLFGFAATVTVGLALASWYVGVRIVSKDVAARSTPLPAAVPRFQSTANLTALYLQVGALGSKEDASFVRSLEGQGFHVQVPQNGDAARIVIGPFSTHTEMEQAQQRLESAGVLAIEMER
jgi:hypothetical protein